MTTMRDAFVATTAHMIETDENVAIVLADIGAARFDAFDIRTRFPQRFINVGIREALAIGAAAGLALEGFYPIVHSYAPFLIERAFEQIKLDFAHQQLAGTLVSIGGSYDASTEGRTHQAPGDVALLSTLPDVRIELPGHPGEVAAAIARTRAHGGTGYVRLSSQENASAFGPGVRLVREGRRATVLVIGPLLPAVIGATSTLDVRVVYTPTVRPIDSDLTAAVNRDGPIFVVEPLLRGTSLDAVSAVVGYHRTVIPVGVGHTELRHYGTPAEHAAAHGLDGAGLHAEFCRWLGSAEDRHSLQKVVAGLNQRVG